MNVFLDKVQWKKKTPEPETGQAVSKPEKAEPSQKKPEKKRGKLKRLQSTQM